MANVSTDIPTDASASTESDSATLQEAVDKLVNEIDSTIGSMTQDDALDDDHSAAGPIDDQVDNLVSDASQASGSIEAPSIDELDARLATAADDEMDFDGDFEAVSEISELDQIDASPAPIEPAVNAGASERHAETDEVEGDFEAPGEEAHVDNVEGDFEAIAPEPASPVSRANGTPEASAESPSEPDQPSDAPAASAGAATKSVDVSKVLSGGAINAAKIVSIPLARASRAQRDTIGWVALNTIFLAMCVWLYVLLIR